MSSQHDEDSQMSPQDEDLQTSSEEDDDYSASPTAPAEISAAEISAADISAAEMSAAASPQADLPLGDPLPGTGSGPAQHRGAPAAPAADDSPGQEISQQWHEIQAGFVDDPRRAVDMAAEAAESALSALAAALQERQSALSPASGADTEQMRAALRGYRSLCQDIEAAGRQLPQVSTSR
jgi:hypothetical protein